MFVNKLKNLVNGFRAQHLWHLLLGKHKLNRLNVSRGVVLKSPVHNQFEHADELVTVVANSRLCMVVYRLQMLEDNLHAGWVFLSEEDSNVSVFVFVQVSKESLEMVRGLSLP